VNKWEQGLVKKINEKRETDKSFFVSAYDRGFLESMNRLPIGVPLSIRQFIHLKDIARDAGVSLS